MTMRMMRNYLKLKIADEGIAQVGTDEYGNFTERSLYNLEIYVSLEHTRIVYIHQLDGILKSWS